jgi:hypothetical protein
MHRQIETRAGDGAGGRGGGGCLPVAAASASMDKRETGGGHAQTSVEVEYHAPLCRSMVAAVRFIMSLGFSFMVEKVVVGVVSL